MFRFPAVWCWAHQESEHPLIKFNTYLYDRWAWNRDTRALAQGIKEWCTYTSVSLGGGKSTKVTCTLISLLYLSVSLMSSIRSTTVQIIWGTHSAGSRPREYRYSFLFSPWDESHWLRHTSGNFTMQSYVWRVSDLCSLLLVKTCRCSRTSVNHLEPIVPFNVLEQFSTAHVPQTFSNSRKIHLFRSVR